MDTTTEFMKGAILGYCQTRKPEEVAELFDDVFLKLGINRAADISAAISARFLYIALNARNEKEVDEYLKKKGL